MEEEMANEKSSRSKIYNKLKEILEDKPGGLRHSEIVKIMKENFPEIPKSTIQGSIHNIKERIKNGKEREIASPDRGLYILSKYITKEAKQEKVSANIKEEDFYQPFADYLINELEECTKAIALGGNKFGDKWGTPDVLGVYKFSEADPIKPPLEIVSAEIKIDTNQLITAFGQACAYKIFSHKVYLVIPKSAEREVGRIESLCLKFGIGLVLFDPENSENPNFEIRTRAFKSEPDYYYVNKYIRTLSEKDIKELL